METGTPRALRMRPMEAAVMPLPSELVTPPVTKTYFGIGSETSGVFPMIQDEGCGGSRRSTLTQGRAQAHCGGYELRCADHFVGVRVAAMERRLELHLDCRQVPPVHSGRRDESCKGNPRNWRCVPRGHADLELQPAIVHGIAAVDERDVGCHECSELAVGVPQIESCHFHGGQRRKPLLDVFQLRFRKACPQSVSFIAAMVRPACAVALPRRRWL